MSETLHKIREILEDRVNFERDEENWWQSKPKGCLPPLTPERFKLKVFSDFDDTIAPPHGVGGATGIEIIFSIYKNTGSNYNEFNKSSYVWSGWNYLFI